MDPCDDSTPGELRVARAVFLTDAANLIERARDAKRALVILDDKTGGVVAWIGTYYEPEPCDLIDCELAREELTRLRTKLEQIRIRMGELPSFESVPHQAIVRFALEHARVALESARRNGRRIDCLREAVHCLDGALRCVAWEDGLT